MSKRATTLAMTLPPRPSGAAAWRWLYDALRAAILAGRLRPGTQLPSTRDLAAQYGMARGTVVRAFEQLAAEGYVEGTVGSGTFVARSLPDDLLEVTRHGRPAATRRSVRAHAHAQASSYARRLRPMQVIEPAPLRAFRTDLPAVDLFPTGIWAQLAGRRLRKLSVRDLLACEPLGYAALREAVADYLNQARGVRCKPAQVAILTGVQEAIDVATRLLVEPGDRVLHEEPGYNGAAHVFAAAGATVVPIPVDGEGMTIDRRRMRDARLAYLTPAHQYPLGVTMSLPRRLALLEWARTSGARLLEDDYDSEYRYSGRPVPTLQGLDDSGIVLLAGSFNKVLFPSLRLGYLVVPDDLVDRTTALRSITVRHPPVLEQRVLVDFIAEGHFGRHLRRMRGVYHERLAVLLESARERLADRLELSTIEAGLQTSGRLLGGLDDRVAMRAAAARGVAVDTLSGNYRGGQPVHGLQLGFAAVGPREIRRGVHDLAAALADVARATTP